MSKKLILCALVLTIAAAAPALAETPDADIAADVLHPSGQVNRRDLGARHAQEILLPIDIFQTKPRHLTTTQTVRRQ